MARIRTIKPEFWHDEKLSPLEPIHRLVFLGLISHADDAGRLIDSVRQIDGLLFPYDESRSSGESVEILRRLGRIRRYQGPSGERLIQITNWGEHQRVKNPSQYVLPPPPPEDEQTQEVTESSVDSTETLRRTSGDSTLTRAGSGILDHGSWIMEETAGERREWNGGAVIDAWIQFGRAHGWPDPPREELKKQGAAGKRIAEKHDAETVLAAMIGMDTIFPHSPPKNQPWDLFTLERKFTEAHAAAKNHPKLREASARQQFLEAS